MNAHKLHECNDEDCSVCNGGLGLCTICGGAEASMPTECPGVRMTNEEQDLVQDGKLDYFNGHWRSLDALPIR